MSNPVVAVDLFSLITCRQLDKATVCQRNCGGIAKQWQLLLVCPLSPGFQRSPTGAEKRGEQQTILPTQIAQTNDKLLKIFIRTDIYYHIKCFSTTTLESKPNCSPVYYTKIRML